MSTIENMRVVADLLVSQRKYKEAYTIYDELYRQMWTVFGMVQNKYSGLSNTVLHVSTIGETLYRGPYIEPAIGLACMRYYNVNLSRAVNEFIKILYGHLQCISQSRQASEESNSDLVLSEFVVLYMLVQQPEYQRKISPIFAIVTATLDRTNRLRRMRSNYPRSIVEKLLLEHAQKNKSNEWKSVNSLLLEYISSIGCRTSKFYYSLSNLVGSSSSRSHTNQEYSGWYKNRARYEQYGTYDRYGHYTRSQKERNASDRGFSSTTASEEEKNVYYGRMIGLKGKLTKAEIRSQYINMISQYHPDKVQHLGPELKELAERKTKEINAAYDWLKMKYRI